jgi:thiol-disulfide isomerase/thioredoxin
MKKIIVLLLLIVSKQQATAQTITGQLNAHAGQEINLSGFNNYKTIVLANTVADSLGTFTLNYPKTYRGMALLQTQDNNSTILLLNQQPITIKGTHITERDRLVFNNTENTLFFEYAIEKGQRTNALSAWRYLENLYSKQPLFLKQTQVAKVILQEQNRILKEDALFVNSLEKDSYLAWFIPQRTLIEETPTIMRTETERIPEAIAQFRNTNFNNPNFKTSGLLKEFIEGHYFLLENMGQSLDTVYKEMNVSTNYLITNLTVNDSLLNTVSEKLLKYFEKRSLISAAAHLSNKVLSQSQCILNDSLVNNMQKYVTLKIGNTAPDIQLNTRKLSNLKKPVLLVFGASWCPHCVTEKKVLLAQYSSWQKTNKNIEVVYISLDTDKPAYNAAFKNTPWQSYCDYKGWDTQAAKDYFVNGTPTYVLLDKDLKILAHPNSIAHATVWVNTRL